MGVLDGLAQLLRSLLSDSPSQSTTGAGRFPDPDVNEAMEELDEFLRTGRETAGGSRRPPSGYPPPDLKQDYANLEVPFGSDIETVRKAYKSLILRYHPDKHAGDPERLRIATEITKKINESFERIRSRMEK
jgi:DnaJ-domain-containing protein 1